MFSIKQSFGYPIAKVHVVALSGYICVSFTIGTILKGQNLLPGVGVGGEFFSIRLLPIAKKYFQENDCTVTACHCLYIKSNSVSAIYTSGSCDTVSVFPYITASLLTFV